MIEANSLMASKKTEGKRVKAIEKSVKKAMHRGITEKAVKRAVDKAIEKGLKRRKAAEHKASKPTNAGGKSKKKESSAEKRADALD
jgi:hypothetical protein